MNGRECLELMYRIGYCDARIDMLNERIQEAKHSQERLYAEVAREEAKETGKEKRLWRKAYESLHLWNIG